MHMRIDWKAVDFDWNHARAFLATAELGSLSAAAKALNSSQPTLSRQVNALEKQLKVALFERVGKGLELTPSGVELAECVKSMGNAAAHLSLTASGKSELLEGSVCISASESMAVYELPAIISKLRCIEPKITIELVASNGSSDLKRREADIAIRSYRPEQLDLIAKKLRNDHFYLYATSSYLDSIDNPQALSDFNHAAFIGPSDYQDIISMLNRRGLSLTTESFPVTTSNHTVYWELVKQGVGIGFFQESLVQSADGVEKVLPELGAVSTELWLVTHRELRTNRRIQYVFEFLSKELSK
ncbi:LysR family transcriptional regulator [Vibrio lentus]|nr:LysR family transcriptional regulator [Vibrio lentus]PMG59425.1 LysR family transcriptional regulator [Vibrio lentus]PMI95613.1 LysR family transcriptional regulator [Vibrio lentus]PML10016.1 LysR family transcriptional regulator [Vibrio lentus]PMM99331.1 LysR family transcriptional regulator [Vibrio lentus]